MRLVFPVLLIVLAVIIVGFAIMNPSESVTVMLPLSAPQTDVPLFLVMLVALAIGVGFTAIIAVFEGATIRLANRRLHKEIQRLETEMSFLSIGPSDELTSETDSSATAPSREVQQPVDRLPDAPVYDVEPKDPAARTD